MAVGERSLFSAPFDPLLFAVARAPWPATWWGDGSVEEREGQALVVLERLLQTPTAAVILEPLLQGAGGMAMVRPAFLQEVQRLTRQAGALLIADEVLTGFGRSGSLFACQRAGLAPDLMALSKGLTGGFLPMGVTLAREALYEGFIGTDPSLTLFHGHSFTANPLGCAAALASLDLLEARPECYQGMEARLKPGLAALAAHPRVHHPRQLGCAAAFDLVVEQPGYLNTAGRRLQQLVQQQGVFLRPLGSVVYLFPPLATTDEQLDQCFQAIAQALDQL
jgi:adenosylmethionine-8-amino-7-oxononanoate aminotransferase